MLTVRQDHALRLFPAGNVNDPIDRLGILNQTAHRQGIGAGDGDDTRPRHIVAEAHVNKIHTFDRTFLNNFRRFHAETA